MDKLSRNDLVVWSCWDSKTPREIVREAATKGTCINLAYKYLMQKHSWDQETTEKWFFSEVYAWVLLLLSNHQYHKASHVLNKVNVQPEKYIFSLAKQSEEIVLRDYLAEQLTEKALDFQNSSPEEWKSFCKHLKLLKALEISFQLGGKFKQNKVFKNGKDVIIINETHIKGLTVDKIEMYTTEWKVAVATHLYFDSFDSSLIEFLDSQHVWRFLIEDNKMFLLCRWICIYFSQLHEGDFITESLVDEELSYENVKAIDVNNMSEKGFDVLNSLFVSWRIDEEMLDILRRKDLYHNMQTLLDGILISFGIVRTESSFHYIWGCLTLIGNIHNVSKIMAHFNGISVSIEDFYDVFFKFCKKYDLFTYLSYVIEDDVDEFLRKLPSESELHKFKLFNDSIRDYFMENKNHFKFNDAIYKTSEFLAEKGLSTYFLENPLLLLALILYTRQAKLYDVFNENCAVTVLGFTFDSNKDIFCNQLPHMNLFFKYYESSTFQNKKDMELYDVLLKDERINYKKLFWFRYIESESTDQNVATLLKNDDYPYSVPYFCEEMLTDSYGVSFKFTHKFYIKYNQMCIASHMFKVEQYKVSNHDLEKRVCDASMSAYSETMKHWNDPLKASLSTIFISMIGSDPVKCRMGITAANKILNYSKAQLDSENIPSTNVIEYINGIMYGVSTNKMECIQKVSELLDDATVCELNKSAPEIGTDLSEIVYEWQICAMFSHIHGLPLPEACMKRYASENMWFPFLLFGDIFMYPEHQMLMIMEDFKSAPLTQHLKHIIRQNQDDISNKNESEECTISDYRIMITDDLWETLANCHSPDDPPSELIKASIKLKSPLLSLLALCYEPNAVGICWANWIITSLEDALPIERRLEFHWDISDQYPLESQFSDLVRFSIEAGCVKMLYESFIIFFPNSLLLHVLEFAYKTAKEFIFDESASNLLWLFKRELSQQKSESNLISWLQRPSFVQKLAVDIIVTNLCFGFVSLLQQLKYVTILCDTDFESGLIVPVPQFSKLKSLLEIAIRSAVPLNLNIMLNENVTVAAMECIDKLINVKKYTEAREFAINCNLPMDTILLAELSDKYESERCQAEEWNDANMFNFCIKCFDFLKNGNAKLQSITAFFYRFLDEIDDRKYKFYILRLLYLWSDKINDTQSDGRNIEMTMWKTYFLCHNVQDMFLGNFESTIKFHLSAYSRTKFVHTNSRFNLFLSEIESTVLTSLIRPVIDKKNVEKWKNAVIKLLNSNMVCEAWQLSEMFSFPEEYVGRKHVHLEIIKASLMLAEGSLSPYDIPAELHLSVGPNMRLKLESESLYMSNEDLSNSFDEDSVSVASKYLEEDRLAALQSFASFSNCQIAKQIIGYLKIALKINWPYEKVLKYHGDPLQLVSYVTGKPRMNLAKTIFKVFDVSNIKVAEYFCNEIITALIAPHLTKVSGLRNKEHFQYTLWGFYLDADLETFINLVPDACAALGEFLVVHFTAMRQMYKIRSNSREQITEREGSYLDLETIIDEEYQNLEEADVQSALGNMDCTYENDSISEDDVELKLIRRDEGTLFDIIDGYTHITDHVKKNIRKVTNGIKLTTKQLNIISIELMIIAHECFTAASDVEGIAVILRSAQVLSTQLLASKSWRLLVRLVTGIGRYTEMAYIFKMLHDSHQFEFLLGQFDYVLGHKESKIIEFKQGLLEYLSNFCPDDEDTYCMVALHFSMYSDAAFVKRKKMFEIVHTLKKSTSPSEVHLASSLKKKDPLYLLNNTNTMNLLEVALNNCSDAVELLLRDSSMKSANDMANIAQLIALQMSLLQEKPNAVCILDLNAEEVLTAISKHLSFMEGLIFAEAANVVDKWHEIVYRKVLKNDDLDFLYELATTRLDVAENILSRYEMENNVTLESEEAINMLASFVS